MSGSFPTDRAPSRIELRAVQPTLVSVTHSLKTQRRSRGGHRWLVRASWSQMERDYWAKLQSFLHVQRGQYETFTWVLPVHSVPRGSIGGTPLVNNASGYAVGSTSIVLDGASTSVTNWLRAGDKLKFGGHAKVYEQTADVNSSGGGAVTLTIWPPLLSAVADNEAVTVTAVPFTLRNADDEFGLALAAPALGQFDVSFIEEPF